ncbi:hypothetical protein FACS18949_00130 [Clostridia bacterium]|nr:hypothetical protein FACS18949_00130 [Clostridia bacterium]
MHPCLRYYKTLPSTNDKAKELALGGASRGTAVVALEQSEGRGQRGRAFLSPVGGLYMSVILAPPLPELEGLTARVGECVRDAVKALRPDLEPTVKPVNDVLLDGKKLCGILTESVSVAERIQFVIVGIGINVGIAPETDQPTACLGGDTDRDKLARDIVERLLKL